MSIIRSQPSVCAPRFKGSGGGAPNVCGRPRRERILHSGWSTGVGEQQGHDFKSFACGSSRAPAIRLEDHKRRSETKVVLHVAVGSKCMTSVTPYYVQLPGIKVKRSQIDLSV